MPPAFQKLRYEEDYSAYRTSAAEADPFAAFKFIPLVPSGWAYVTLGGEGRWRYEFTQNPAFGEDPQDEKGVALHRYFGIVDLHLGPHARAFAQLASAHAHGRAGGPSPVDENRLEFQNLFADARFVDGRDSVTLRGGRQELAFGSGRLVDVREGPNVRRTFDGGRGIVELAGIRIDGFYVAPRVDRRGVFDDATSERQELWGAYAVGPGLGPFGGNLDVYYLGYRDDAGQFDQGTAREVRHSLGLRWFGERSGWDWNWEALYQFGSFGQGEISAWTLATVTGYTWAATAWKPRAGLSVNVASGDKNPADANLQTFNPLFPRGSYFSEDAVLGPRNFFNLQPSLTVQPTDSWTIASSLNLFWRLESTDGVYTPSGQLLRSASGSDERYVATALSLSSEWRVDRNWTLTAVYAHVWPGAFLQETGPSKEIDFFETTLTLRF